MLVLSLTMTGCLNAQVRENLIKTSLAFPLGEILEISYERVFSTETSAQISVFLGGGLEAAIMPEFRYYLSETKVAPNGVFVAPFVFAGAEIGGGGIMVGVQRLFKERISLDASLGPFVSGEGVAVMGGLNIGIAF